MKQLIPKNVENIVTKQYKTLKPVQKKAIEQNYLESNALISSPTASGKTLLAEISFLNTILNENKKALYIAPLKSLVREKYEDFTKKYSKLFKITHSVRDIESRRDMQLGRNDLIILTSEKLESLLRHETTWINRIGLVIVDEIHLIGDTHRGANLEIVLTKLKNLIKDLKIIGLSATIKNDKELADWLNAKLIKDAHRPVELLEGVLLGEEIDFLKQKEKIKLQKDSLNSVVQHFIEKNNQLLIFTNSRRLTQSIARKLPKVIEQKSLSKKALNVLGLPTPQCEELSKAILKGVAFHHAGLVEGQKKIIENAFRKGQIKIIACTPTLAMGMDLPADVVIINNVKRYSSELGYSDYIKVGEYKQIAGRAGRPSFTDQGRAIMIAGTQIQKNELVNKYILGEAEEIYSSLSHEPSLRTIILSLITGHLVKTETELLSFLKTTFYYFQYNNLQALSSKLRVILDDLEEYGFIEIKTDKLTPTTLGRRVSELYLDPMSANTIVTGIKNSKNSELTTKALLHLACLTFELKPLLNLTNKDRIELEEDYNEDSPYFLIPEPHSYSYESWDYYKAYKTSLMFYDWINELTDKQLMIKYKTTPGDMRAKNYNLDWLLYATKELARLLDVKELITPINDLRIQVKYGIKEELIPLIKLKGIGRVRARKLNHAGLKTIKDIKQKPEGLTKILGEKIAQSVLEQI